MLRAVTSLVTGGAAMSVSAYPNAALSGTTNETNLASVRIPGNTLGPQGQIRLTALFTYTNSANAKNFFIRFNSTSGAVTGGSVIFGPVTTTTTMQILLIIRNANATGNQVFYTAGGIGSAPYGATATALGTVSVDTTQDSYINMNASLALATETATVLGYSVEVYRG